MMTPKELDAQAQVHVDRWIDVNSDECKSIDDTHAFTLRCLKIGLEDGLMFTDSMGRVWGKGSSSPDYWPFHFEHRGKIIGYRLPKTAAN